MGKRRKVIKKKQKIEKLKEDLKLNDKKLQGVVAETKAKLALIELEKEDILLRVDEIELVIKLGLKTIEPKFEYERHKEWQQHAERSAKHNLLRVNKKLVNLDLAIEEGNKYLESQASQAETIKKGIVAELKILGLDEKDIFKVKIPSYIG